ncbi:hypothetical protein NQ318_017125 [Aromia moschata]|uniref:NACHT domain-containing protein n=1 Tax=Aromia moschata TaxID=1265417 RepID=A0AAV8X9G8_9CUCU|nr:hypothetical protein NQ318_017125 [Aromia moschata]
MSEEKRVLHIIPSQSYLLSVVKVWQAIECEKLTETLFLRLDRESNVNKYAVDAFELKRFTHLVIVDDSQPTDGLQQIHDKLFDVLNRYVYKKVILIARTSKILDQIKSKNADVYKVFTDEINFTQLVEEMQESMRKTKNITFQGEELSLNELCLTPETLDEMLDAQILETLAKRENVRIGHSISTENNEYHITRNLWDTQNSQRVSKDIVYDYALACNRHVILISAEAGMGKSATLTKISLSIKEKHPHLWIVRINLNTFTKCLLDCHNNNKRSLTAWELLNSLEGTKLINNFEKQLFLLQERIVLMIDAVDEVSPKYTDIVLDFLVDCKNKPNFKVIFITTRPHVRKALEDVLQPITFTLAPFSKNDQVEFVSEYWSRTLSLDDDAAKEKCQLYANALISQVEKWINDSSEQFSGVPLQTRMLAEVFMTKSRPSNKDSEEWQGCKEFLASNLENATLPKKVNLLELYQIFIDKKQDVFIYEKGNESGNLLAEEALRRIFEDCQNHHRLLALKVVVEENFLDIFHCFRDGDTTKSDHTNLLKIGIVCEIDSDLHFIHRTFAEYFTAQVLMMELTREHQNKRFRQFFLKRVLKYRSFKVIRAFLDELLKQQLDAMSVTTLENYSLDKNQFKQDEWGFSFLHIISEEGRYGILNLFFKRVNSRKSMKKSLSPVRRQTYFEVELGYERAAGRDTASQGCR